MLVVDTLGRAEAPTVAELVADMGRKVEIVTGLAYVGCEMPVPAWHNLMERLLTKDVTLTPFTGVWEIEDGSVDVYNVISWQPRTMEGVDTVVFASGGVPEDGLAGRTRRPGGGVARDRRLLSAPGHRDGGGGRFAGGACDVGVKRHLHQDVAQFIGQLHRIAVVDGLQRFVAFLQQVALQRFVGLLCVPRATARPAQPRHNVNQRLELADALLRNGGNKVGTHGPRNITYWYSRLSPPLVRTHPRPHAAT